MNKWTAEKKGRNCILVKNMGELQAGDKAWVFDVTDTSVMVLSKTEKDVTGGRSLKKVTMTHDEADDCVKLTIGKPRSNFKDVLITQSEVNQLVQSKLDSL
jgi:hypothetical protein